MKGKLYGVGVGPGDPECMTLKAIRVISECDVVAIPSLTKDGCLAYKIAKGAVKNIDNKEFAYIDMPMTKNMEKLKKCHTDGAKVIKDLLDSGKDIAFLTLGDPTVYSTYIYIHEIITKEGYKASIINGITSFTAVAASLNLDLVQRSEELHIIPGAYDKKDIASYNGTKVLMKNGRKFKEIKQYIRDNNLDAMAVSNCTMEDEKVYTCINDLDDLPYYSVIVIKDKGEISND